MGVCQDPFVDHSLWAIFASVAAAVPEREAIVCEISVGEPPESFDQATTAVRDR
jgi:hypothetical protein